MLNKKKHKIDTIVLKDDTPQKIVKLLFPFLSNLVRFENIFSFGV